MGLDQSIYMKAKPENIELQYWRKQPAIHDWFEKLAIAKGVEFESFNCIPVRVKKRDIKQLIKDIKSDNIDYDRAGFFFGSNSNMTPEDLAEWKSERIEELKAIKQAMKDSPDSKVYYDSWW